MQELSVYYSYQCITYVYMIYPVCIKIFFFFGMVTNTTVLKVQMTIKIFKFIVFSSLLLFPKLFFL